jgi:hypothetical protein
VNRDDSSGPAPITVKPPRDYRLDFFRGLALVFIFIDHIPNNLFSYVTLRSFALCDAAEVFIFISGYTAALVYGRAMLREGWIMGAARIYRRVWQLYVAHLCIFLMYNAEVSYTMLHFNNPLFADELQAGAFLAEPTETLEHVLLLQFQPSLLNILPLYISLLLIFPLVLLAMRQHMLLALAPSAALYLAVQIWRINLTGYPGDSTWYFDPFAYQFLFVIAAMFGFARVRGMVVLPAWRWLEPLAVAMAAIGVIVQVSWTLHDLFSLPALVTVPLWADDKTTLPPLRILNMLALAYLVARLVPQNAGFIRSAPGWLLVLCGQNSLYIFCLTILLSVLANIVFTLIGNALIIQVVVNMIGFLLMLGLGTLLAWFNAGGRLPARPAPDGETGA